MLQAEVKSGILDKIAYIRLGTQEHSLLLRQ